MSTEEQNYELSVYGLDDPEPSGSEHEDVEDDNEDDMFNRVMRATMDQPVQRDIPVKDIVADATEREFADKVPAAVSVSQVRDDIKKELTCQVCLSVMYKPTTLMCQHTFCYACLKDMESKACPMCRQPFVVPGEYNRVLDNVVSKCFPEDHARAAAEDANLEYAKDARKRIEDELHKRLYEQVARRVGVEVQQQQDNNRVHVPQRAPVPVDVASAVRSQLPEWLGKYICNPAAVADGVYQVCAYAMYFNVAHFAWVMLLWATVPDFNRVSGLLITTMILAAILRVVLNLGLVYLSRTLRGVVFSAVSRVRQVVDLPQVFIAGGDAPGPFRMMPAVGHIGGLRPEVMNALGLMDAAMRHVY